MNPSTVQWSTCKKKGNTLTVFAVKTSSCAVSRQRVNIWKLDEYVPSLYSWNIANLYVKPQLANKELQDIQLTDTDAYIVFQLKRYKTYTYLIQSRLATYPELEPSLVETVIGEVDEPNSDADKKTTTSPPTYRAVQRSLSDRYSYRAAIYQNDRMEYDILWSFIPSGCCAIDRDVWKSVIRS